MKKYDFTLAHSQSRSDVEDYFYKYGWPKTLEKLIKHHGQISFVNSFHVDENTICDDYLFKRYTAPVEVLTERAFPFRKNIHIVY